jgi:hypothetical protein
MNVEAKLALPEIESYVLAKHGRKRALTPAEEDVLARWGEEVRAYVVAGWPVDTGTSADAWEVEADVSPGRYGLLVSNEMDYASFVHRKGGTPEDDLWIELIREAWATAKPLLVTELKLAIDRTEATLQARAAKKQRDVLDVYRQPRLVRPAAA